MVFTWSFQQKSSSSKMNKNSCLCKIWLLDDRILTFEINKYDKGSTLFYKVISAIEISHYWYFGLIYESVTKNTNHCLTWLKNSKPIYKQIKCDQPTFCLSIKYYDLNPSSIDDQLCKRYIYLQLRRDMVYGRLFTNNDSLSYLLSLCLRMEMHDSNGEIQQNKQQINQFITDRFRQMDKNTLPFLVEKVLDFHSKTHQLTLKQAETEFLNFASCLSTYGLHFFTVRSKELERFVFLAVGFHIIRIYSQSKMLLQEIKWQDVDSFEAISNRFVLKIRSSDDSSQYKVFILANNYYVRLLFNFIIDAHSFYLFFSKKTINSSKSTKDEMSNLNLSVKHHSPLSRQTTYINRTRSLLEKASSFSSKKACLTSPAIDKNSINLIKNPQINQHLNDDCPDDGASEQSYSNNDPTIPKKKCTSKYQSTPLKKNFVPIHDKSSDDDLEEKKCSNHVSNQTSCLKPNSSYDRKELVSREIDEIFMEMEEFLLGELKILDTSDSPQHDSPLKQPKPICSDELFQHGYWDNMKANLLGEISNKISSFNVPINYSNNLQHIQNTHSSQNSHNSRKYKKETTHQSMVNNENRNLPQLDETIYSSKYRAHTCLQ